MNRYEREIEEILRNLDQAEPKANRRTKSGNRPRKSAGMHMSRPHLSFRLSQAEWLLLLALGAALVAGGYAYTLQRRDLFTLILALIVVACLILVACSQFIFRSRPPKSLRYGNITITPLRRNPFTLLRMRWNLLKLRMRYRRHKED